VDLEHPVTWASTAAFVVLVAAFVWPALYNGQPFFFSGYTDLHQGSGRGIQAAFGHKSACRFRPTHQRASARLTTRRF